MENTPSNVNEHLLNHIMYLKVYKEGEQLGTDLLNQMDKQTKVEVHLFCTKSDKYKLKEHMKANMTVEELDIYIELGVTVW